MAWGRNRNRPGLMLDGFAAEAAAEVRDSHTLFARVERVEKDELFPAGDPLAGRVFDVGKISAGYRFDFWHGPHLVTGAGALGSIIEVPEAARAAYGDHPLTHFVLTLGGYSPHFTRPARYPTVPPLGFRWQASSHAVVTGTATFAWRSTSW